jgi:predicted dehydrogenase
VQKLKQTQEQGVLGEIVKVQITHHGPLVFTDAEWLWDERRSRYLLWEFGIHFLDILVHLLGPHEEIVSVIPAVHPNLGHTTDIEATVRFAEGKIGRLEIVADSTRHSSFFTQINVYGTAADTFIRWFPPSIMIVSGQVSPFALMLNEARAIWQLGTKILTGQYLKQRNISHYRLISDYVDWLTEKADFALKMENALPTMRLLAELSDHIPAYRQTQELVNSASAGQVSSRGVR